MNTILERIRREPVILAQAAAILLGLGAAWGLSLTDDQTSAVMAALAFLGAVIGRQQVTPNRTVAAEQAEVGGPLVAGEAADVSSGEEVEVVPVDPGPLDEP